MNISEFFESKQNFLVGFIVTLGLGLLLQLFGFIWAYAWILMVVAGFMGGFLIKASGLGFLAGFLGIISGWLIYFIILMFQGPFFEFATLIANVLGLGDLGIVIIILALLVGGLIGGFGALNGHFIASIIYKKE
ncbi:MAG: hypothetical protein GF329_18285 [Candidatus Lokiarchaeota archaeon]|nr:hypothetical protein [Candidatus Lokiarchaeota archaeon]